MRREKRQKRQREQKKEKGKKEQACHSQSKDFADKEASGGGSLTKR